MIDFTRADIEFRYRDNFLYLYEALPNDFFNLFYSFLIRVQDDISDEAYLRFLEESDISIIFNEDRLDLSLRDFLEIFFQAAHESSPLQ